MEIIAKGKPTFEDLKIFYKEVGARSVGYRIFKIALRTFLFLELLVLLVMKIVHQTPIDSVFFFLLSFFFIYLLYRKLTFPKALKKLYDSDPAFRLENELKFYEDRIESKTELSSEIIKKENIYYVVFGSSAVYIYKSRAKAEIIPKHFFETEEQWNAFVEFVKSNYIPGPKKSRIFKPFKWWHYVVSCLIGGAAFAIMLCGILLSVLWR